MCSLNEEDWGRQREIELSNGCIIVIPWFNGCLLWNKAVLRPTETVLCPPPIINPLLDEIGVQNEEMSGQNERLNDAHKSS